MYAEAQRVACVTHPVHRQQVLRVRYGTMATPVNPNHNVVVWLQQQVAVRAMLPVRPGQCPSVHRQSELRLLLCVRLPLEARRVEALRVPLCTQCNLPDAQHLTFECPAVLSKIREVLRVVNFAASSDQSLRHLIHSADGTHVLLASLRAFPFQHVLNTHCAYATLRAAAAPAWALQYKPMYTHLEQLACNTYVNYHI